MKVQHNGPSRYERGWERLRELDSQAGRRLTDALQDIAPDLAVYITEFVFGDVYTRPGLDLQRRRLVTITALLSLGDCETQLELHITGGLNAGLTKQEIVEAMIQCAPFTGFPRVFNALRTAKRVFADYPMMKG
ncbi:carboxymuconolactone decarboxylase family protein [Paenibacillus sp. P26]|nr:carboxymuconolactone decarboxylase family protein [Paenibacillus sp. P26]